MNVPLGVARRGWAESQAATDWGKKVVATEAGRIMRRMMYLETRIEMGPRK